MSTLARQGESEPDADSSSENEPSEGAGPSSETEPAPTSDLPLDVVFDILSVERRRRVIDYLLSESDTTTLSDLAEHVAGLENDKPVDALTSQERKRVYVGLYQCHLPKMDDAGVVDFDADRKAIEIGPHAEQLQPHLELARATREGGSDDRGWVTSPLGTSAAGGFVPFLRTLLHRLTV